MFRWYKFLFVGVGLGGAFAAANGASLLTGGTFPKTANDVSFQDRMENKAAGYEPYKDLSAYKLITIESEEKAMQRRIDRLEEIRRQDITRLSKEEYCDKYPLDDSCPQHPGLEEEIVSIGDNPNKQNPETQPPVLRPTPPRPEINISVTPSKPQAISNNNATYGQKCTPSAYSDNFVNKILTSGRYETIDPAFEKAMVQIFRMEGECGNHPADSGGYTCYGFAQNYNPDIDVRQLTRPGAEDRTYTRIYQANGIDKLPDSIRGDVLRGSFGSGLYGVQQLQKVLNLPQTKRGIITDEIAQAARDYDGDLHNAYWDSMQQYYQGIVQRKPSQKVFLKGWMNGVKLMRENGCNVEPARPLTR